MSTKWEPFSARLRGASFDETLHEGVPRHLRNPLLTWLRDSASVRLRSRVAARVRIELDADDEYSDTIFEDADENQLLDAVDFVLHSGIDPYEEYDKPKELLKHLRSLLIDSGSAYQVNDAGTGLERRVDATVASAAIQTVESTKANPASEHLSAAWAAVYGLHPNPPVGYSEAIKAVEAAAQPVIEPRNAKATLGTMIRAMENAPGIRFQFVLADPSVVVVMCRTLWQGQTSRHGSGRPTRHETQTEAEAAIHLAVTLVSWFGTGVVRDTNQR